MRKYLKFFHIVDFFIYFASLLSLMNFSLLFLKERKRHINEELREEHRDERGKNYADAERYGKIHDCALADEKHQKREHGEHAVYFQNGQYGTLVRRFDGRPSRSCRSCILPLPCA